MTGSRAPLPKARVLTPLTCELGGHSGNFSIYRAKGEPWGCKPCIAAAALAKGVPVPKWLGV